MIPPHLMVTIKNQAAKTLLFFYATASLLLLAGCAPPGRRAFLAGKQLMEKGKYPQAIEKLKTAAVLLGNTNAQVFNYLGLACHEAGQLADAQRAYQRALALNRDLTEAHYNLGCLWLEENKLDQAKTEFLAYTLRKGDSMEGWLELGETQLRCREWVAAERSFNEALRLGPQNAEALTGLGLTRLKRERPAEAAQLFERALKIHPDYRPALLNLAIVAQEQLGDRRLALQKYRQYLALNPPPEHADSVKALIRQFEQENQAPRRLAPTNTVAQGRTNVIPPKAPEPSRLAASPSKSSVTNTILVGAASKAELITPSPKAPLISNLSKPTEPSVVLPATNIEVVNLPAEPVLKPAQDVPAPPLLLPISGLQHQVTTSSTASAIEPRTEKHSFFQRLNPFKLLSREQKAGARVTSLAPEPAPRSAEPTSLPESVITPDLGTAGFARYAYRSPASPAPGNRKQGEILFAQGREAQRAERLSEAIQAYTLATQADPAYYQAYYNLGLAATEAGNLRLALAAYEDALVIEPQSMDARYNFALLLKQANYVLDAINELEKNLANYPNESRTHLALANLYAQQLHDTARARQHYVKALTTDPHSEQAAAVRYWLIQHPE